MLKTPKPNWSDFDILGTLHEQLDVPMGYDTDVNVACLGEATFGCARGLQDVVYLTIGTGVGAGVLSSGSLIHGAMHPEAGHIPLVRDAATRCLQGSPPAPFIPTVSKGSYAGRRCGSAGATQLLPAWRMTLRRRSSSAGTSVKRS